MYILAFIKFIYVFFTMVKMKSGDTIRVRKDFIYLAVALLTIFTFALASGVQPFGASSIIVENSETATPDAPTSVAAQAGNVTSINIVGTSVTQSWQGYFGNVSGSIQLSDSSGNAMYNWSLADPQGEIYASTSNAVSWANIKCFNWNTDGAVLETSFNIESDDVDGVNETFNEKVHPTFFSNNIQIAADSCMSANIYDSSGSSNAANFEEVLLWDDTNVVFTSLIEEGSINGFDGKDHDFEMLVLEDGHGTDTAATTYYFYVELE